VLDTSSPAWFADVAPMASGGFAVVGEANGSDVVTPPTIDATSLGTSYRPHVTTDALVVANLSSAGALSRGWDVPTTGRVQPGNPGSFRGYGVALAPNGAMIVGGELDGIVNLDRCDITARADSPSLVFFAIGP
jgi:hypothetical protein